MATKRSRGAGAGDDKGAKKPSTSAGKASRSASSKPKAAAEKNSTSKATSPKRKTSSPPAAPVDRISCECSSHQASKPSSEKAASAVPAAKSGSAHAPGHVSAADHPRRPAKKSETPRMMAVVALIAVAFIASYNFAATVSGAGGNGGSAAPLAAVGGAAAAIGGGGCCGGGGAPIEKQTELNGDVQTIAVDTSSGGYDPNIIVAKAGVPIEIEFSQSSGCLYAVQFPEFGIYEDLQQGPKTIKLPALEAGEYQWACGMNMATGTLVVQ